MFGHDDPTNRTRFKGHDFAAIADFEMASKAVAAAAKLEVPIRTGNLFSADLFYTPETEMFDVMERMGILGIEMEAAGLYGCAAECGKSALALCTVSDHIRTGETTSSEERSATGMPRPGAWPGVSMESAPPAAGWAHPVLGH